MPDDIKLQVRLPADLHRELQERARLDQRSLNGQILWLLRYALEATAPKALAA
jgi:hypothetical protein